MINFHGFRRTDADSSAVLPTLSLFAERFPNYQKRYLLALVTVIVVTMWGFFLDTPFLWDSPSSYRFTLASTEFPDIKRGSGWSCQIKFFPQAACVQANLIAVPCSPYASCADFRYSGSKSALCDIQVCCKHPCLHFIRTTNNKQNGVSFPGAVDDSFYSFSINTLY